MLAVAVVSALACAEPGEAPTARPNILWIIWDTVRAENLGIYGYARPTTPFLDAWAEEARVFDDVISAGTTTVPAHASMFTGLLPSQHGAHNQSPQLATEFATLAEILAGEGYATYLFAANPHLRDQNGFGRGFDRVEHPWSPPFQADAQRLAHAKAGPNRAEAGAAAIKDAGPLAARGLTTWLAGSEPGKPFFAVLNYMEAHRPWLAARRHRERFMSPEQIERSYASTTVGMEVWNYTLGVAELSDDELQLAWSAYDATISELDELLRDLLTSLESQGLLEDTVVVLTSDHGELLGEHHMLEHQFSIHEELVRIPLVLWYPRGIEAGREDGPVSNLDLFPTLLELAGAVPRSGRPQPGVGLLAPRKGRERISEYPAPARNILGFFRLANPGVKTTGFERSLRSLYRGPHKLVWASDGDHALYDLEADPAEQRNLLEARSELAREMAESLDRRLDGLGAPPASTPHEPPSPEMRARLEALGYLEQ